MSKYANQTLRDPKTGKAVSIQVEFTEAAITARCEGNEIVTVKCVNGEAQALVPAKPASMTASVPGKEKRDSE